MPPVSSYDPACDQCRLKKIKCGREQPECVNCKRSEVPCGFSERGKRSNQSRIVVDHLEDVKSRLTSMEKTISSLQTVVRGVVAQNPIQQKPSLSASASVVTLSEGRKRDKPEGPNDQLANARRRYLVNERYYGPSSLVYLLGEIQSLLDNLVKDSSDCTQDDTVNSSKKGFAGCIALMDKMSKVSVPDDPMDLSSDGLPLTLPPKGLLDALIEPYFSQINCLLPVFRREKFCEHVEKEYEASTHDADGAWLLCFNNIIVQTLKARSFGSKSQFSADHWGSGTYSDVIEEELLRPFLVNSRRGLGKLERFLEPKLVNVQALLSMCLVAQGNFEYKLASLLLHHACFVAKSIGLHQQNAMPRYRSFEEDLECKYVFWALYVIDKTISLMTGHSGYLSLHDCDVDLPDKDVSNPYLRHVLARIELACIQEDCYQDLYSTQALRQDYTERNARILSMDYQLDTWAKKYLCLRSNGHANTDMTQDYSNTAMSYYLHSTRILTHRFSQEAARKVRSREEARMSIQMFHKLSKDSTTISNAVILQQAVQNRPLLAFFVLFEGVIQESSSEDLAKDVQLMHLALDILQTFHHSNKMHSYTKKLLLVVTSCCQVATAITRNDHSDSTPSLVFSGMENCDSTSSDPESRKDPAESDAMVQTSWLGSDQPPILFSALDQPGVPNGWDFGSADILDPADRNLHTRATASPNTVELGEVEMGGQLEWQKGWRGSSTVLAIPSAEYSKVNGNGNYPVGWP